MSRYYILGELDEFYLFRSIRRTEEEEIEETEYWTEAGTSTGSSSRVQVMPAHGQAESIFSNSQVVLMNGQDPLTLEEQAEMMKANKDKFKCLYLLVETAIAVRHREKDDRELYVMAD